MGLFIPIFRWFIIHYYTYCSGIEVVLDLASGSPFNLAPAPFWPALTILLFTFFLFGTIWYFTCILHLPCILPVISHFSKELWFLLVGEGSGSGCEVWSLLLGWFCFLAFLMDKAGEYMHEYTHTCKYKYKYICSYTGAHMNMLLHIVEIISSCHDARLHPSLPGLLFLPSLPVCIAFLWPWEPWLPARVTYWLV